MVYLLKQSRSFFFILTSLFCLSCASAPIVQPQVNSLVVAERFNHALRVLEEHQESYGKNNRLLYLLDYGTVLHISGDYGESIKVFEEAKSLYDQLFTVSVTGQLKTWLINDYYAPYRGEDFERVMINVFQALNFVMMGNINEALVEARNVDETLERINQQYKPAEKNQYKEDAFARLLMGIIYEHKGSYEAINDAHISYKRSVETYEVDYHGNYGMDIPKVLKENILATAQWMGEGEYKVYQKKFPDVSFVGLKEKQELAEVYVFYYYGLSPIKHQVSIPIPLPNGFFTRLAFPHYDRRRSRTEPGTVKAVHKESQTEVTAQTQEVEDIASIAAQALDNRKARVLAKAVLRSGGKVVVEDQMENRLRGRFGDTTADVFRYVASLYNISSEQADLRSWQTLPAQIRIARLWLKPGVYELHLDGLFLGSVEMKKGAKEYFIVRTNR